MNTARDKAGFVLFSAI